MPQIELWKYDALIIKEWESNSITSCTFGGYYLKYVSVGSGVGKLGLLCIVGGNIKCFHRSSFKKLELEWITKWPSSSTLEYLLPKNMKAVLKKYLHIHIHSNMVHNS